MIIKIENVHIQRKMAGSISFKEFVLAIKKLKVGQSFLITTCPSNHRTAISALQYIMDVKISVYKEGNGYRIGRIK